MALAPQPLANSTNKNADSVFMSMPPTAPARAIGRMVGRASGDVNATQDDADRRRTYPNANMVRQRVRHSAGLPLSVEAA